MAVVVTGLPAPLEVRIRTVLALSDPDDPATQQPYHAGFGLLEKDGPVLRARLARVRRAAHGSVRTMLDECHASGLDLIGAGLVVGSTIDPDAIANPHIRAHALEGRLFRTVLDEALTAAGVASRVLVEREAFGAAGALLDQAEANLRRVVSTLGRGVEGPWRAEEKLAALAAWMMLADPPSRLPAPDHR